MDEIIKAVNPDVFKSRSQKILTFAKKEALRWS